MAEIEDRLVPCDGLNNYNIVLTRMELPTHGGALFTFGVTCAMLPVADFQVNVPACGQSMDRMTVEAHDALIDILRQLTFRAEKARMNHDRNARPVLQMPSNRDSMDFLADRRTKTPSLDDALN